MPDGPFCFALEIWVLAVEVNNTFFMMEYFVAFLIREVVTSP